MTIKFKVFDLERNRESARIVSIDFEGHTTAAYIIESDKSVEYTITYNYDLFIYNDDNNDKPIAIFKVRKQWTQLKKNIGKTAYK